jgi:hypothetical protein
MYYDYSPQRKHRPWYVKYRGTVGFMSALLLVLLMLVIQRG